MDSNHKKYKGYDYKFTYAMKKRDF